MMGLYNKLWGSISAQWTKKKMSFILLCLEPWHILCINIRVLLLNYYQTILPPLSFLPLCFPHYISPHYLFPSTIFLNLSFPLSFPHYLTPTISHTYYNRHTIFPPTIFAPLSFHTHYLITNIFPLISPLYFLQYFLDNFLK